MLTEISRSSHARSLIYNHSIIPSEINYSQKFEVRKKFLNRNKEIILSEKISQSNPSSPSMISVLSFETLLI